MKTLLETVSIPRVVGSEGNHAIIHLLKESFQKMDYHMKSLPFQCKLWNTSDSYLECEAYRQAIFVSPYSNAYSGTAVSKIAETMEQLETLDCADSILFLTGELAKEPLQPKDFPFYYPEEHKKLIDLLEMKRPCAIIAATGKNPMCGQNPFPLFEDGNFSIPSGYLSADQFQAIKDSLIHQEITLHLASENITTASEQLYAYKKVPASKGKVVICAHMDSKNDTYGALDNASGVVTLLKAAEQLQLEHYDVDLVPFNTEEYYGADGELLYLNELQNTGDTIKLLINIDSVGHIGSKAAVSMYHLSDELKSIITDLIGRQDRTQLLPEWYAGDHSVFAFQGVPCIAISSSDMWEGGLDQTHTMEDTVQSVDETLLTEAASLIQTVLSKFDTL